MNAFHLSCQFYPDAMQIFHKVFSDHQSKLSASELHQILEQFKACDFKICTTFLLQWRDFKSIVSSIQEEILLDIGSYLYVKNSSFIRKNQLISEYSTQTIIPGQRKLKPISTTLAGEIRFENEIIKLDINLYEKQINKINEEGKEVTKNQISNMSNIHQSFDIAKNCEDVVYFVEDDYLHKLDSIEEMIFTYEKISTQLNQELILCPSDYPYLYSNIQKSNIFLGNKYHWRSVEESLCTFLTSSKLLNKHWDEFTSACKTEHYPFGDTTLHSDSLTVGSDRIIIQSENCTSVLRGEMASPDLRGGWGCV
mgnify:CR=1 FL=1